MNVNIIDEFKTVIYVRPVNTRIFLIAGSAGSGKSTVAKLIREMVAPAGDVMAPRVEVIPFAQPIKMIATRLGWNGQKTPQSRKFLQLFGTEMCRNIIGEDIWVNMWFKQLVTVNADVVIADDLRFQNEYDLVAANCDSLVSIKMIGRSDAYTNKSHESEQPLADDCFDHIITNTGTLQELECMVTDLLGDSLSYVKPE